MIDRIVAGAALLLIALPPAAAHRLDEYLQATTLELEKARVRGEIRLVPGVSVFRTVFSGIDRNRDGAASDRERRAYANRVLRHLSLSIDGRPLKLRLVNVSYDEPRTLRRGTGEIRVRFEADAAAATGERRLIFENRHQPKIGSYLVNTLVPRDAEIRIERQQRSPNQSSYELTYTVGSE